MISGGFAARLYGATRDLADIDIDIPEDRFAELIPQVKEYIKLGPARYKDDNWDLFLMTLYSLMRIDDRRFPRHEISPCCCWS